MIMFPLLDRLVEFLKKQGGYVYWAWIFLVGISGAIAIVIWEGSGFDAARLPLCVTIGLYVGLLPFIVWWENKKAVK